MNVLPIEKQARVIAALTEGVSQRAVERLCDVNRETVGALSLRVGEACARLHDAMLRNLQVSYIKLDEQWAFVQKKQRRVAATDSPEFGDAYVFVARDATSKAVLPYVVGKRTAENTMLLVEDLSLRVINRAQITADGFAPYPGAIALAFGRNVDFAQLVKEYQSTPGNDAETRYSPGRVIGIERNEVFGTPDPRHISTSYIERFNLTTRLSSRRFTRLTNGHSKRLRNHRAAVALQFMVYNACRVHETLRVTPLMQLGLTDHVWSIGEMIERALAANPEPMAPKPAPEPPARRVVTLRVIRGGK